MATAPVIEHATEAGTDIVVAVHGNPGLVLFDNAKFDAFYAKLKADVEAVPVDLATKKGRDAIASIAAKVRSEKARIDKDRLRLTKEWRDMTAQVNGAWNTIKDQLDTLAVEARAPLTDWEDAEKARVHDCQSIISEIKAAAVVEIDDTAASVRERGATIWNIALDPDKFGDMLPEAQSAKDATVATLKAALARLTQEEADRAELARLRAENEAREAEAARVAAAQEAARKEAEELRLYNERRAAAEKAEIERLERAKAEAAATAQREAEKAATAERERIEREHAEALAAERMKAEEAEKAAQAARDRIAKEAADRKAEADRLAAEQAKRDADQRHRTKVKSAAKDAIMTCGADEETARKIVMAIIAGEVPHVTLRF